MEPFRFVHASRVQLDSPVIIPGESTPADRQLAEDASILAFRALFDDCITRDADLLLLTGDTFGAAMVTLREQMELEQGLRKLSDHDITVVIVPGTEDPASAWREHMQLPEGVLLVEDGLSEPIRVFRNDVEVATVFPIAVVDDAGRPRGCRAPQLRPGVFRIGLVGAGSIDAGCLNEIAGDSRDGTIHIQLDSRGADAAEQALFDAVSHGTVDYVAVGIAGARQTSTIGSLTLHNPGPLQALDDAIAGSCGASLVTVEQNGKVGIAPLPCARIRWEHLTVAARDARSIEDLAVEMESALNALTPAKGEELWIVEWRLAISQQLSAELQQASLAALWELIDSSTRQRPTCRHILQLGVQHGETTDVDEPVEIGSLEDHLRADLEKFVQNAAHAEWGTTPWGRRVIREASKLSPARLLPKVRQSVTGALGRAGLE